MHQVWIVVPGRWPSVERRCARCDAVRAFECTRKFRVNANGRKLDAWLLYVCGACEKTWRCSVARRRTVDDLGAELLGAMERNDEALARRYAFDPAIVGGGVGLRVDFRVERAGIGAEAVVRFAVPFEVRSDALIAQALSLSRSSVARALGRRAARRLVRDGDRLDLRPWHAEREPAGAGGDRLEAARADELQL